MNLGKIMIIQNDNQFECTRTTCCKKENAYLSANTRFYQIFLIKRVLVSKENPQVVGIYGHVFHFNNLENIFDYKFNFYLNNVMDLNN